MSTAPPPDRSALLVKKAVAKVQRRFQHIGSRRTTPVNPQHNDFYIVEFPKSGITWLSTILANTALIASGRNEVASYTSAYWYVPDIHVTRNLGPALYDRPPVRFIKSHAEFNPRYAFVMYLVRHPLGVMKSWYRFDLETREQPSGDFHAFCVSAKGIPAWRRHVNSWLCAHAPAQRLHLCRYEDLIRDPVAEIALLSEHFGWAIEASIIREAVSRSSVENMQKNEALHRQKDPRHTMKFVKGGSDLQVEQRTLEYVERACAAELKMLGYAE